MKNKLTKERDRQIEVIFYRHSHGTHIPILDLEKIFQAGHKAFAAGESVEQAIITEIAKVRVAVDFDVESALRPGHPKRL